MTDVLAERFAALADHTDDSNWLDVQRRARRRARVALPAALIAAAAVTAAAVAASGGWLFSGHGPDVMAVTHVTFHGQSWKVTLREQAQGDSTFFLVSASSGTAKSVSGSGYVTSRRAYGPPFAAASANIPGGQIWAGTTTRSTVRVAITDFAGRIYTADTIAPPKTTGTPYRYFAIAVGGSPAASLTTYDAVGKSTRWRLRMGA